MMSKSNMLGAAVVGAVLTIATCGSPAQEKPREGPAERTGESIDRALKDLKEGARNLKKDIKQGFERTKESVKAMGVEAPRLWTASLGQGSEPERAGGPGR